MPDISMIRLHALRAAYLLIAAGLAATIWPRLLDHGPEWPLMNSVVAAMLGALSLLALLGLRYPLQMLPILLFEFAWKFIWLVLVALPLVSSGRLDEAAMSTVIDCSLAAILIPLMPWRYVVAHYVRAPGEPWRSGRAPLKSSANA